MTAEAEVGDLSIILRTAGKSVRLGSPDKWRRAIALRDLKRETVVELNAGGLALGNHAAGDVQALRRIFDELDPLAAAPADEPLARIGSTSTSDFVAVEGPPRPTPRLSSQPVLAPTLLEPVVGSPSAQSVATTTTTRVKTGSAAGWLWLALIGAAFLVLALKEGVAQSSHSAIDPPYPISLYPSPTHEQVEPVGLNLHTGPGASYPKIGSALDRGAIVTAFGAATAADGGRWEYVQTPAGPRGYVNRRLLGPSP